MTPTKPQIFFHVGLGKTASTYLQYAFFPKLKNIQYVQRNRFPRHAAILATTSAEKVLFSREYDQQLEDRMRTFSADYPDARILIVFRRHDGWMASQYRRYVKNGGALSFSQFFDVEQDTGLWKRSDAHYMSMIRIIERYFPTKPLVLFYEDLKEDPYRFFDQLTAFIGADYNRDDINLSSVHSSYNRKQLLAIRRVSGRLFPQQPRYSGNRLMHWLQVRSRLLKSYLILYGALLLPDRFFAGEELIPSAELEKVRNYFQSDWEELQAYARANNPVNG